MGFMCGPAGRISVNLQSSQIYKPEETVSAVRETALRRRARFRRRKLTGNNHGDNPTGAEGRIAIVYSRERRIKLASTI